MSRLLKDNFNQTKLNTSELGTAQLQLLYRFLSKSIFNIKYSVVLKKRRKPILCTVPLLIGTIPPKETFSNFIADNQVRYR